MTAETPSVEELSVDECLELAASQLVGRFAVASSGGAPLVVPVNFVLDGETVVFSSDLGQKLAELDSHLCSFQVDWIDPLHHIGWSVLFRGAAALLESGDVIDPDLHPWVGQLSHGVRLTPVVITGRRIRLHRLDVDGRGYR